MGMNQVFSLKRGYGLHNFILGVTALLNVSKLLDIHSISEVICKGAASANYLACLVVSSNTNKFFNRLMNR